MGEDERRDLRVLGLEQPGQAVRRYALERVLQAGRLPARQLIELGQDLVAVHGPRALAARERLVHERAREKEAVDAHAARPAHALPVVLLDRANVLGRDVPDAGERLRDLPHLGFIEVSEDLGRDFRTEREKEDRRLLDA